MADRNQDMKEHILVARCHRLFVVLVPVLMQVAAKQMVGLYLTIWVAQTILPQIRGVQVAAVGTGVMGYLGNKGDIFQAV